MRKERMSRSEEISQRSPSQRKKRGVAAKSSRQASRGRALTFRQSSAPVELRVFESSCLEKSRGVLFHVFGWRGHADLWETRCLIPSQGLAGHSKLWNRVPPGRTVFFWLVYFRQHFPYARNSERRPSQHKRNSLLARSKVHIYATPILEGVFDSAVAYCTHSRTGIVGNRFRECVPCHDQCHSIVMCASVTFPHAAEFIPTERN